VTGFVKIGKRVRPAKIMIETVVVLYRFVFERPADNWESEDIVNLSQELRRIAKPIIIATNKRDVASPQNLERIEDVCQDVVATSGAAELALRLAHQKGLVNYVPGNTRLS